MFEVGQRAIARQIHEPRFPAVVVGGSVVAKRLLQPNLVAQPAQRIGAEKERVVPRARVAGELGDVMKPRHERIDLAFAIEGVARPGRGEIPPLGEIPGGLAQAVDRSVLAAKCRSAQRTPYAVRRVGEHLLQPARERFVEQSR